MWKAQAGTIRFLRLLMIGSIALPIILFIYASSLNYNATYRAADERIERSLAILQENARNTFQPADLLINTVNVLSGGLSDDEIKSQEERLHLLLQQVAQPLRRIHSVWIFGADGTPLVSSNIFPVPRNFKNTDRDYFKVQAERDAGFYIGAVVPPKVQGDVIFSVSRRRPGDTFRGIVAVAIRPVDIQTYYKELADEDGSYYGLIRSDGTFLARYPAPVALGLRLRPESATMSSIAMKPDGAINSLTAQTDGIDRRLGYRRLRTYPVYVLAGVERRAIIGEWMKLMSSHLIFGIPATAIMFSALYLALQRTRRLHDEEVARVTAEGALRQSQKMDSIGQLTGGVAHDFNNLLTIVIGNLDAARRALEKGAENATMRALRAVENAGEGARRAANLTQRLLAFSRQQPLEPSVVDVNAAIKESAVLLKRALGETYDLEAVGSGGAWNIEVDAAQLDVALLNLVVNARDAMPDGGKVTLETSNVFLDEAYCTAHLDVKPGQYVQISVTDTGSGMNADVLSRAFEPFFTTKPAGRGTGLGLSQVYGFVKQTGGHITIYSEPGEGTTVKMYFSRAYKATEAAGKSAPAEVPAAGSRQRILVVEDDDDLRQYVSETLKELNYDVEDVSNGEQALSLVEREGQSFDVLLTDVVMPGLNGRQVADRVTEMSPSTRVIYMTGYSRNAIIHHGRLDPGLKLLQKPFSRDELAAHIGRLLSA